MTAIQSNVSLRPFHTFGVAAVASRYAEVDSVEALQKLVHNDPGPVLILGGGSNILPAAEIGALVIRNCIGGIAVVEQDETSALVAAGGGVNWHMLVGWSLDRDLGGLENLSLIPGTVGAAPIQNIGAYGVELQDVFERLEAVDLRTGTIKDFSQEECRFGYRDSVFKQEARGRYAIARVYLRLTRAPHHRLNTSYGAIRETLAEMGVPDPGIREISEAVVRIRQSKLPDPAVLGNAGSFFKNPVIASVQANALQERFPEMPAYPAGEGQVKVPAGWLIERCGWKGRRVGAVGCYEQQALVLVNYGGATGAEVLALARQIMASVEEAFGIQLEMEVNVWG